LLENKTGASCLNETLHVWFDVKSSQTSIYMITYKLKLL